jgi:hypothetical protein
VSKIGDLRTHLRAFLLRFGEGFTECPDLDLTFDQWFKTIPPPMLPSYEDLARAYAQDFFSAEWQGPAVRRSDVRPATQRIGAPPVKPVQLALMDLKQFKVWCVDYARYTMVPPQRKLQGIIEFWDKENPGQLRDADQFLRSVLQTARKRA